MMHMDAPELQRLHDQLQEASQHHVEWMRRVVRTLVCRLPPDPADLLDDAHRHCSFGQWYHGVPHRELWAQPAYAAIETEHTQLHRLAAAMLRGLAAHPPIREDDFDALIACSARLRLEIDSLRHEIQAALRNRDALTGAYARVEILPALREAAELARRHVQPACIAFMDLDHFKPMNDVHGHAVGDRVLAGAVRCITDHLRPYDRVFRYGGDEFLLLLPGTHLEDARRLVERVRVQLAGDHVGLTAEGEPLRLTASFGLTPLDPELNVEECVDHADRALMLAKAAGRNRVVCWDPAATTGTMLQRELLLRR